MQIFKIVLSKAFDLKCTIPEIKDTGEPLLMCVRSSRAADAAATSTSRMRDRFRCTIHSLHLIPSVRMHTFDLN